jgi:ABC-type Zn uptake system ZnuABC Zn-binding protein ZnuA
VLVLQHPYYGYLAGKPYGADLVSIRDAMRPAHSPIRGELRTQVDDMLAQHTYPSILFEDPQATTEMDKIAGDTLWRSYYLVQEPIPGVRQGTRPDWLLEH